MQAIDKAWCMQIDVTNYCIRSCLYCSRYNRHLRLDQRAHMSMETFESALHSLRDWPSMIGIIGGEPLLHPKFRMINATLRRYFPAHGKLERLGALLKRKKLAPNPKLGLWTSGVPGTKLADPRKDPDIAATYGFIAYNPHDAEQVKKCRHQPLTVAIREAVPDKDLMWRLIEECWVQRTWCATITHKGAYFCEVGAAQDILLNDGANAWPIERDWWKRTPESKEFIAQKEALCPNCGMAIPMEREPLLKQCEKITPRLLETFLARRLKRLGPDDVEIFDKTFSREELRQNILTWYPGNYREDKKKDEEAGEGRGFRGELL